MSEHVRHHEFVKPLAEIAQGLGEWVMNKLVPAESLELHIGAVATQPELPFSTVPDLKGRDL